MKTVWVASTAPAYNNGGSGGFFWNFDRDKVEPDYEVFLKEARKYRENNVRLVKMQVNEGSPEEITDEIDLRLDELEMTLEPHRQYLQRNTDYIPVHNPIEGEQ